MIVVIYSLIIFAATFLGAFVGLGGGVIIKPLLDLIGYDSIDAVNFISSCAVFSMSISSTVKHIRAKTKFDYKFLITLSAGAVIGGITGSKLFDYLLMLFSNNTLKSIQGFILCLLLVMSVIYINLKNAKSFRIKSPVCTALAGLLMGLIASFSGVGGGPINVAFLVLFFSLTVKEAAFYSIGIIFFSQLSKLITIFVSATVPDVSITTLAAAIIFAVAGGAAGAAMNKKSGENVIRKVFTIAVASLAFVNLYNALSGLQ